MKYNNSALQILRLRKDDSDLYYCAASNLLGRVEKKTLLVVVSPPRFTVKPPAKVVAWVGESLKLNCSATGDPQPVIRWKKQGGQLPVGRSQQINGALVIQGITMNDRGRLAPSLKLRKVCYNSFLQCYLECKRSYEYLRIIYENWGVKNYIKEDHRNYRCNFAVAKRKPEKNSGLYGIRSLDLCVYYCDDRFSYN